MVVRWLVVGLLLSCPFVQAQTWPAQLVHKSGQFFPVQVEVELKGDHYHAEQSLVLMVNVYSRDNLATLDVNFEPTSHILLNRLDGPISRRINGVILNQYAYMMTPLEGGLLSFPVLRIQGSRQKTQQAFDQKLHVLSTLNILPSNQLVNPWLALQSLRIRAKLKQPDTIDIGQPLEMTFHLHSIGLSGAQLPSLEDQLQSKDFKVYKSSTKNTGKLSDDGLSIQGSKIETYALIPLHAGRSLLPQIQIDWWNTKTNKIEHSRSPMRQFFVEGDAVNAQNHGLFSSHNLPKFRVSILVLISFILSWWAISLFRRQRISQLIEEEITMMVICNARRLSQFLIWLSPIRRLQRMRQVFIHSWPRSYRLWYCVKLIEHETDPDNWSYMLRFLANKHLGFPAQASLQDMGQKICACHDACNKAQMLELMRQLEANLYGKETLDFKLWKRAFRQQLGPIWFGFFQRSASLEKQTQLPELNPSIRVKR